VEVEEVGDTCQVVSGCGRDTWQKARRAEKAMGTEEVSRGFRVGSTSRICCVCASSLSSCVFAVSIV